MPVGLADFQSVFRIEKNDAKKGGESRVSKRNRQPVSCLACRTRKLKCDRQVPCSSCSKRGGPDECMYSNTGRNGRGKRNRTGESKNAEAHLRLQKLEEMVTGLMQSNGGSNSNSGAVDQNLEDLIRETSLYPAKTCFGARGRLDIKGSETQYHGATHWTAILENIRDVQVSLETESEDETEESPSSFPSYPDIFLDTNASLSIDDVYKTLGEKSRIDKILNTYFNHKHNQNPILHVKKFMREYESFWADPSSVSFLWISLLFSALYIGTQVVEAQADREGYVDSATHALGVEFLTSSGQALIVGKYERARPYSVEALLLYTMCRHFHREDQDTSTWLLMSVCARKCLRMGYHQDPRHLAHFSPFEAEMRRRTFFTVEALDFLISFQAGLPAVIPEEVCDTEHPSNLFDTDFDEDCETLPPSRPSTDPTPMLYYCYKSQLARVTRRAFRLALAVKGPSYQLTMELDAELQKIHAEVPPSLQMKPLASCFGDQPYIILHRLNLDLMYLKSLCILHRNYITHERSNPAYEYSRKTCIDSALQMLRYQAEVHSACQPGGEMHKDGWMASHLLLYDYLLAVMIICLELYETRENMSSKTHEEQLTQIKKHDALKLSYEIWSSQRTKSKNARRATNVLGAMLFKLPRPSITATPLDTSQGTPSISQESLNGMPSISPWGPNPEWDVNGFNASSQWLPSNDYANMGVSLADPLNIFSGSNDIDWELIDQCLLGHNDDLDVPPVSEG